MSARDTHAEQSCREEFGTSLADAAESGVKTEELGHARAWSRPAREVRLVGKRLEKALARLGIHTIEDLLFHAPSRYLDMGEVRPIGSVRPGEQVTVAGTVKHVQTRKARKGLTITSIGIFDGTGYLFGTWFNQEYVAGRLKEGSELVFSGKVVSGYGQMQITQPFVDVVAETAEEQERVHTTGIVPLYPATEGLSSTMLRRIMRHAVDDFASVPDPLPHELRLRRRLVRRSVSLADVHFPSTQHEGQDARRRLIYEELLIMQVGVAARRARAGSVEGIPHGIEDGLLDRLRTALPFDLTADQANALADICKDMRRPHPMNRLLQGEVGSGKTAVAMGALLGAVESGHQAAIMAPTELLAKQHCEKVEPVFALLGVRCVLLTGAVAAGTKSRAVERIKAGEADVIIGTHALIQDKVDYDRLGLVVIDEQHRFGVRQRLAMREKGPNPDVLVMTATPIPRTLALTLYGDLDKSTLRELPGGRRLAQHVETRVCDAKHREGAYDLLRSEVAAGRQAYVVCPLIEESEKVSVKAVTEEFDGLRAVFPELRIGLLHGRLKAPEKASVMEGFRAGNLDVLLATTVIEVGIDVPNATVMIVEDAERFGLSQLHQLRGRIGRGAHASYCLLFADPTTDEGRARMEAIAAISDGFELAEADMRIRGEGQLFGPRQAGLPDLRMAQLQRDRGVLDAAREDAVSIISSDPCLASPEHRPLALEVDRRFAGSLDWVASG